MPMIKSILNYACKFAQQGFYVFPMYGDKCYKPYGWSLNKPDISVDPEKIIPATTNISEIQSWPEKIRAAYNSELTAYGVLGKDCIIFDLDVKNDKNGVHQFKLLTKRYSIPKPSLVVRTKSGGYHLYYAKPKKLSSAFISSSVNLTVEGNQYFGLDVRGDKGMVVGPTSTGPASLWSPGKYQIISGEISSDLTILPEPLTSILARAAVPIKDDIDIMAPLSQANDELSLLSRGELPEKLSAGHRNDGYFKYLCALHQKGFPKSSARAHLEPLIAITEDFEEFAQSTNIEDMIDRVWRADPDQPKTVALDIINSGLYMLTGMSTRSKYIILEDNPYIKSRQAQDLTNLTQLLARYERTVIINDKPKKVNPANLIPRLITSSSEVEYLGFWPGRDKTFTLRGHTATYLNLWQNPLDDVNPDNIDIKYWEMFTELVGRIFGPTGSEEYKLGLQYPAWLLQFPGIKPAIAPYVVSQTRGVGKSLYLDLLKAILGRDKQGRHQAVNCRIDDIGTRFFDPSAASVLIFDEVQFSVHRDMRKESQKFWRGLKPLITENETTVEVKGGATYQAPCLAGVIMMANSGNNFPIEENDRRIWMINNEPGVLERGVMDEFFGLRAGLLSPKLDALIVNTLRYKLKTLHLTMDLRSQRAPHTEYKEEAYEASLTNLEYFWSDYFKNPENKLADCQLATRSMIEYLITVIPGIPVKSREEPSAAFLELKRKGYIQNIKALSTDTRKATRSLAGIYCVNPNGGVYDSGIKQTIYSLKNHGSYNNLDNDTLRQIHNSGLNSLKKWQKAVDILSS